MLNRTEILAPAGDILAVRAAVNAHTDAVYLGGSLFSARAFAGNFDEKELLETIDYCHVHDVKVYMAINTLLKNDEIKGLQSYVEPYYREGVDGIIVQDAGVLSVLSECFPKLPLHGSTQMSVSSVAGAAFLKKTGMTRFVPSRELSLEEIVTIKNAVDIEIETFVHGAMCYCYSGRCLMSSFAGGRSGNRGRCAQPCRKRYHVGGRFEYALSLKDMCMLKDVGRLIDAGIDSFKIEGRMKKPEYVAATVNAYRTLRDMYISGDDISKEAEKQEKILLDIYNRGGFYSGYYYTGNGKQMLANRRPSHTGVCVGHVSRIDQPFVIIKLEEDINIGDVLEIRGRKANVEVTSNAEASSGTTVRLKAKSFKAMSCGDAVFRTRNNKLLFSIGRDIVCKDTQVPVNAYVEAKVGKPLRIRLMTVDGRAECEHTGPVCTEADSRPVTAGQIWEKMSKTGGTSFRMSDIDISADDNVFIQMSSLNCLRREALDILTQKLITSYHRKNAEECAQSIVQEKCIAGIKNEITVLVSNSHQLDIVKNYKCISNIIVDYNVRKCSKLVLPGDKKVFLALPEIMRQRDIGRYEGLEEELKQYDGVVVRNMDELGYIYSIGYTGDVIVDSSLYAYNDYAFSFYRNSIKGKVYFMASQELTFEELDGLCENIMIKLYGYQKVMVTANCIASSYMGGCISGYGKVNEITDEMGNRFYAVNDCQTCSNIIYNGVPTSILDKYDVIKHNYTGCYIEFTIEDNKTVKSIMDYMDTKLVGGEAYNPVKDYTRGHYYKGID